MKQAPKLAQARAYWMLARKADKAGNFREGDRYRKVAESKYREYLRQKAFTDYMDPVLVAAGYTPPAPGTATAPGF